MPVPGLELAPGLKRVWDVSRYGVAIPDLSGPARRLVHGRRAKFYR